MGLILRFDYILKVFILRMDLYGLYMEGSLTVYTLYIDLSVYHIEV